MTSTQTRATFVPDTLDRQLFAAFPGLVMRKDLTQAIRGTSKAPSYVIEFMLGKYCANLFDDDEVRAADALQGLATRHQLPRRVCAHDLGSARVACENEACVAARPKPY